jgi:hypothetical protein
MANKVSFCFSLWKCCCDDMMMPCSECDNDVFGVVVDVDVDDYSQNQTFCGLPPE